MQPSFVACETFEFGWRWNLMQANALCVFGNVSVSVLLLGSFQLLAHRWVLVVHQMTARKARHVFRTLFDLLKLLPLVGLLAAPGGTLLLPVAVKFFPNVLPSSFLRCGRLLCFSHDPVLLV